MGGKDPREGKNIAQLWLEGSVCERDVDGATRALTALPIAGCYEDRVPFLRTWCEGIVARLANDEAAARAAFTARSEAAKLVVDQSNNAEGLSVLGMADAALGHKEDAIREGRRAVELLPVTKDSAIGAMLLKNLALIYAFKPKLRYVFTLARIFASHKLSSSGVLKPEVVMTVFGMNIQIIRKCDGGTPNATHQNRTFILA